MLSHAPALILGIIAERPINPYEIKKLLESIQIRKWLPMAASSTYATIRALLQKGYIAGEPVREGNMPEKTVYSITETGKDVLHDTLAAYLGSTELDSRKFHISTLMICHLPKEEAVGILRGKIEKLYKSDAMLGRMAGEARHIPFTGLTIMNHERHVIRAELASIDELLAAIEGDTNWNYFITRTL